VHAQRLYEPLFACERIDSLIHCSGADEYGRLGFRIAAAAYQSICSTHFSPLRPTIGPLLGNL
jgi:hypothetical protein